MFRDVVILLTSGAVTYLWLSAIASPFARSVRSLMRDGASRTAWTAFALASGSAVVWTVILVGSILLGMMLEPRMGLAFLRSDAGWRGISLGNVVWICQMIAFARMPRLGPTLETATALAIVALVRDDPWTLSRVERLYRTHAVAPAGGAGVISRGVRRVAA